MTAVWAHRGASAYAPENTLPAFALAAEQGADGIELDVRLTADRQVVVLHDATVDRTTDGHGEVSRLSAAEVRRLDASHGYEAFRGTPVPTLAEVLDFLRPGRLTVNIELKDPALPGVDLAVAVADVIAAAGMGDRVVVSSFDHYSLKTVQHYAPALRVGLLLSDGIYLPWEYAAEFGAYAIHPQWRLLRVPGFVEYAHAATIAVHVWTVDDEADLARVMAAGVDAVITNHPDRAVGAR